MTSKVKIGLWGKKLKNGYSYVHNLFSFELLFKCITFTSNDLWPLRSSWPLKPKSKILNKHNSGTHLHIYIKPSISTAQNMQLNVEWPTYEIKLVYSSVRSNVPLLLSNCQSCFLWTWDWTSTIDTQNPKYLILNTYEE